MDDNFILWPCGWKKWKSFPDHLNSVHWNIQLTTQMTRDGHLPFLNTDAYRRPNGSLDYKAHCNPTHTNLHLNYRTCQQPSNKQTVLPPWHSRSEHFVTRTAFTMRWSFSSSHSGRTATVTGKFTGLSALILTWFLSCPSRMPSWHIINSVGLLVRKM
jgi:hypothetical protein